MPRLLNGLSPLHRLRRNELNARQPLDVLRSPPSKGPEQHYVWESQFDPIGIAVVDGLACVNV